MHRRRPARAATAVAFAAGATATPFGLTTATGADSLQPLHVVRTTEAGELGLGEVAGISRDGVTGELLVTGSSEAGSPTTVGISSLGDVADRGALAGDYAGESLAYDPAAGELVAVAGEKLVAADSGGTQTDLARLGITRVGGIEYGPDGSLLVLDSQSRSIVTVPKGAQPGQVTETPLESAPASLASLAYNPADQQLYSADSSAGEVHSYALDGTPTGTFDLAGTGVQTVTSMEFAPTADTTDDPAATSLFVTEPSADGGQVLELSATAALATAASTTATLVRETDLSAFDPPSPDSAGITYVPGSSEPLLITDSEVNEMPLYTGFNVFRAQLDGTEGSNGDTTHYTIEPTGVSYNAANGHILVSDDDRNEVYDAAPGPDGVPGTSDDTVTSFDTGASGNGDAEDVAVGPGQELYVIDGVNKEVYVYSGGGSYLRQFDVAVHGAQDPEGIAYDSARNTMLVLDQSSRSVYEVTPQGQLVNTIDIASASTKKAAGITLAPPSGGGTGMNLYIVARGVDNNTNPDENDGKLFEMSTSPPPIGNLPPVVDAGPDMTTVLGDGATLTGQVTDDGLPSGSLTSTWTNQSPATGTVTFGDTGAPSTSATFSATGTYVLRLTGDDGETTASDDVVVDVVPPGAPLSFDVAVATSSDDAEEKASGSVALGSSDLELVTESSVQKVGVRFAGVGVPPGATILGAYVQFTVDEVSADAADLTVEGIDADNTPTFTTATGNVSTRPRTAASVGWVPPGWQTAGANGPDQRTPDLAPVVQEIVDRAGWADGNAMAFVVTGSGRRTAEAFDGTVAPVLHIDYQVGGPAPNRPPVVDAGGDQAIELGQSAMMGGSYTDDDLPEGGPVTYRWEQRSGPADAQISAPDAPDPTVDFPEAGIYTLRLTVNDGELPGSDEVAVTVIDPNAPETVVVPVSAGSDDAEEKSSGSMRLSGADLELVTDRGNVQTIGLRFAGVPVPHGASITNAYVQFTADEVSTEATSLVVRGQAADSAGTFTTASGNVSSRERTNAQVFWSPAPWNAKGAAGAAQQTPDLSSVVQEVVNRPGWSSGNAVVLMVTGSGTRTAEAFDGTAAPELHIDYQVGGGTPANTAPLVVAGADQATVLGSGATLEGSVSDDGMPSDGSLSSTWRQVSGPAPVQFADPAEPTTTATFEQPGTHVLELEATDGALTSTDRVAVDVVEPGSALVLDIAVAQGSDDAEERVSSGSVRLGSGDMELGFDRSREQVVGLRFAGVAVPQGATITNAYVQFTVDEVDSSTSSLTIRGQAHDDGATFQAVANDISRRATTSASVPWSPPAWTSKGLKGTDQRTPDLVAVLQEIVDRSGWASGNAAVLIVHGNGERTAEAFEGGKPAVLHIEYEIP